MLRKKTIKIIGFVIAILILLIVVVRAVILYNQKQNQFENKTYDSIEDFYTVEEVAKYMDCEYIREEKPKNLSYDLDIYLKFKYDLYTDGASNKNYFYRAIVLFAQVTGYQNIRLIDDSKSIVIAVVGDSDNKKIKKIYINGKENYFGEEDTIKELEKYQTAATTRITVNSKILQEIINNHWNTTKVKLGTQESTLDDYEIYFDEGYRVKKSATTIFNIDFMEQYKEPVVNNIKVGTSLEEVQNQLGTPAFSSGGSSGFIGYTSYNLYVFFWADHISIYRNENMNDEQQFLTLLNKFREDTDVKSFINQLTDLWPDYTSYEYDSQYLHLTYILKGIDIKINVDQDNGVTFYSNYNGSYLKDLIEQKDNLPKYTYYNNQNMIFQNEQRKASSLLNRKFIVDTFNFNAQLYKENRKEGIEDKTIRYERTSNKFVVYQKNVRNGNLMIYIISSDNQYPDSEIETKVNSYLWLDDTKLIYSIKNKGIYLYDAITRETKTLLEGNDTFQIKDYANNKIYYDNMEFTYVLDSNLPEKCDSMVWLNNENIAYSIRNQGIYRYNINTKETNTILEGNETFDLKQYVNGRIYYDNTNIMYLVD